MYTKLELLGKGNFGQVWKEVDTYTGRVYATKYVPLGRAGFHDNLDEARLMVASKSRHTVLVYSAARESNHFIIRTQYMPNGSLENACNGHPVPMKDFYVWFPDICRGVADLHSQGILHRDLKPANVLLDENRDVRIGDFGLALLEGTNPEYDGTAYIPTLTPESNTIDSPQGDIYALACLAYRILNGEEEWQRQFREVATGSTPMESLRLATVEGRFPNRKIWAPHISPRLKRVLVKSLSLDPAVRYSTALELCEAIENTIPKIYWGWDLALDSWTGESKDSRERRQWNLNVVDGDIDAKQSINGSKFRRMNSVSGPIQGETDWDAVSKAICKIEAGLK